MVVLNVEMISKEIIKPSSPTPHNLRNQKLSFLDQIAPSVYVPLIFFYQNDESSPDNINHVQKSLLVKQSLSKILTHFYPIAGRIQENSLIDCNDAGAEFMEARVHARLTQVIQDPKMEQLKQLLPVEPLLCQSSENEKAILSVKISSFDCGGIAVGVCLSHKIADGTSFVAFMNAWAAMCRAEPHQPPNFDLAVQYFPPMDLSNSGVTPNVGVTKEKITTKRLVFDKEKLAKLKQLAAAADHDGEVKNPTRVEAVSAFIWRHFIEAAKAKKEERDIKSLIGVHAVNLRTRTNPAIPEHAFGNCWRPAFAFLSKLTEDSRDLVTKLRVAIRGMDEGYIKKVQNGEYMSHLRKTIDDLCKRDTTDQICNFSSWCRFPMYEVDFGWGKPLWVCTITLPFKNLVILMSTPSGDGIEAWVNVPDHDLKMLETHYDLLT